MKPLRIKIQDEANLKKVPLHVIEKDYALSYVLAGMAKQSELSHSLIFKGGTALKKIFFGDYRFSEDLDFTVADPNHLTVDFLKVKFFEIQIY